MCGFLATNCEMRRENKLCQLNGGGGGDCCIYFAVIIAVLVVTIITHCPSHKLSSHIVSSLQLKTDTMRKHITASSCNVIIIVIVIVSV